MKLVISTIVFLSTLGVLWFHDSNAPNISPIESNLEANIYLEAAPKTQETSSPMKTTLVRVVPSYIASPSPTLSPTLSPTTTPSATPSMQEATFTPVPSGGHIWYTSSYRTAKYYYCDTDEEWKKLSPDYIQTFVSEADLLAKYSRILHEPCK